MKSAVQIACESEMHGASLDTLVRWEIQHVDEMQTISHEWNYYIIARRRDPRQQSFNWLGAHQEADGGRMDGWCVLEIFN